MRMYSNREVNIMCEILGNSEYIEMYVEHDLDIPCDDLISGPVGTHESVAECVIGSDHFENFLNTKDNDDVNGDNVNVEIDGDVNGDHVNVEPDLNVEHDLNVEPELNVEDNVDGSENMSDRDSSEDDNYIVKSEEETDYECIDNDAIETSDEEVAFARRTFIDMKIKLVGNKNGTPPVDSTNLFSNSAMIEDEHNAMEKEFIIDTDLDLSSDTSEDESKHRKKKKKKYQSFNPKIDPKDIKFTLGMEYKNAEEFKEVVRAHAIVNGIDFKFMKNEKKRVCVVCMNSTVCP